jgi:uncharacterized protein DUF6678
VQDRSPSNLVGHMNDTKWREVFAILCSDPNLTACRWKLLGEEPVLGRLPREDRIFSDLIDTMLGPIQFSDIEWVEIPSCWDQRPDITRFHPVEGTNKFEHALRELGKLGRLTIESSEGGFRLYGYT